MEEPTLKKGSLGLKDRFFGFALSEKEGESGSMAAPADGVLLEEALRFLGTFSGLGSLLGLRGSSSSPSQSKGGLLTDCGVGRSRASGLSGSLHEAEGLEVNPLCMVLAEDKDDWGLSCS